MARGGKKITDKDEEEIGLVARRYLMWPDNFVLLVDDLEGDRVEQAPSVFQRYRDVLDTMLGPRLKSRASVHFLVNMLEAYFFGDSQAINAVLGTTLPDHVGDVELIRHPKNDLKKLYQGYDEIEHGRSILAQLNTERVLADPDTCAWLRTMFSWCFKALGEVPTSRFQLEAGQYSPVTHFQIDSL